jgi:UDP-N-acetylmuramyl pentapeptide phosphotransferase/UDP-N-acetylglucosamine-1-phosphate transferase
MNVYIRNAVLIGLRQLIVVLGVYLANRGLTLSEDQQTALANIVAGLFLAIGGFLWSNVAKRKDQKNPDPAKSPQSQSQLPLFMLPMLILLVVGCTADDAAKVERRAKELQAATTQPVAQIIVHTVPATGPLIGAIGVGAGAVALLAGYFARRSKQ